MTRYRWYYIDVVAGDLTAVVIFMLNPVFSARSLAAAMNVALYRNGKRIAWVMTDYPTSSSGGNEEVRIGDSRLVSMGGGIDVYVSDHTPFLHKPVKLEIHIHPMTPAGPIVRLDAHGNHAWQALAPRAAATLTYDGVTRNGMAYHDSNWGDVSLGTDIASWTWSRSHTADETIVRYFVDGAPSGHVLRARADDCGLDSAAHEASPRVRSAWGLPLPKAAGTLIESAPFYARLHRNDAEADCLTEVAHFARFRGPMCRWMPYFRSRRAGV